MMKKQTPSCPFQGKQFRLKQRRLVVDEVIAQGGFSIVMRVTNHACSETFALKRMLVNEKEALERCMQEIDFNTRLNGHRHIAHLIDSSINNSLPHSPDVYEVLILYKLYPDSIEQRMSRTQRFSQHDVISIFSDVCHAVAALHQSEPPIFHRDLKVENLLVDTDNCTVVLCDFGSATSTSLKPSVHGVAVVEEEIQKYTTLSYRSPEMVDLYEDHAIDARSDIWALGCLLYRLCFFSNPFAESVLAITSGHLPFPCPHPYDPRIVSIIKCTLSTTPSLRPDIYQLCHLLATLSHRPPSSSLKNINNVELLAFEDLQKREETKILSKPTRLPKPDQPIGTSINPRERPRVDALANRGAPISLINIHNPSTAAKPPNQLVNENFGSASGAGGGVGAFTQKNNDNSSNNRNINNKNSKNSKNESNNINITDLFSQTDSSNKNTAIYNPDTTTISTSTTTPPFATNLINLKPNDPFTPTNDDPAFFTTPANHKQALTSLVDLNRSLLDFNQSSSTSSPNDVQAFRKKNSNPFLNDDDDDDDNNTNLVNNVNNNKQQMNNSLVDVNTLTFPSYPVQRHRRNYSDTSMLPSNQQQQLQKQLQQLKQHQQLLLQQQQQQQHCLQQMLIQEQQKLWKLKQQQQQQQQQLKALTPDVMMPTQPFPMQQQQPNVFQHQQQQNVFQQLPPFASSASQSPLQPPINPFTQLSIQQQQRQLLQQQQRQQNTLPNNFYTSQPMTHSQSNLYLFNPTFQQQQQQHQLPLQQQLPQQQQPQHQKQPQQQPQPQQQQPQQQQQQPHQQLPQQQQPHQQQPQQQQQQPHQQLPQQQQASFDAFGDVPFNKMVSGLKLGHKRSTSGLL